MQQNKGVTLTQSVSRQSSSDSNIPRCSRIVEKIYGILYCSCQDDVKSGYPYIRIQCVLSYAFQANQFHPDWKRTTTVDIKTTYKNDIVGISQSHDHFEIEEEDRGINEDDRTGVFVQQYAGLPQITQGTQFEDSPAVQETALEIASRFPKASKRKMTCSSPRRPIFLHTFSFECTKKLCINFLNQFSVYFHI